MDTMESTSSEKNLIPRSISTLLNSGDCRHLYLVLLAKSTAGCGFSPLVCLMRSGEDATITLQACVWLSKEKLEESLLDPDVEAAADKHELRDGGDAVLPRQREDAFHDVEDPERLPSSMAARRARVLGQYKLHHRLRRERTDHVGRGGPVCLLSLATAFLTSGAAEFIMSSCSLASQSTMGRVVLTVSSSFAVNTLPLAPLARASYRRHTDLSF